MIDIRHNIERQPASLRQILAYFAGEGARELDAAAELLSGADRIIFTGMGGSLYALMPAATHLARHGVLVNVMDAGELLYYADVPRNAAVVAVSRSGRTAEVVRLAANLTTRGIPMIAITNCPASDLALAANVLVPVVGDLDHGVSIQTYTGGLLTSLFLAACVTGTLMQFQADATAAIDTLEAMLPMWWKTTGAWRWSERSHFYFLARGYSMTSACEGCLLMQELARRTATWYSAAEFRQGPVETLRRGHTVVLFTPEGETTHLTQALASDLVRTGAEILTLGAGLGVAEHLAPLLQIIPVQMAAYSLAAGDQETPGQFRFASPVTEKEDGLAIG